MVTVKETIDKNGKTKFHFKYYNGINPITHKPSHTTHRGFNTKKDALKFIEKLDRQKEMGTIFNDFIENHYRMNITFEDVYNKWLPLYKEQVMFSTFTKTKTIFEKHIIPYFGLLSIEKITVDHCQKFINELAKNYQSFRKVYNYLSKVFIFAESRNIIDRNPNQYVVLPKSNEEVKSLDTILFKDNYYGSGKLVEFLEKTKIHHTSNSEMKYAFFNLLAFTGLRKSEALALTWNDISFEEKLLYVTKSLTVSELGGYEFGPPKNKKARIIALDNETLEVLISWQNCQKEMLKDCYKEKSQLIFMNSKNEFINPNQPQNWINKIQKSYNLKKVSPHGLRHSHCTYCFDVGMNPRDVKNRLGHSDINITMNTYDFVNNENRHLAAEKINSYKQLYSSAKL